MKIVKKLAFSFVLIVVAAPAVGLADDPTPCYPCTAITASK